MDTPGHWTQQPFDGRPISDPFAPLPPPVTGPPPPERGSNAALIVVIVAVVLGLIGVAAATHPWSRPARHEQVAAEATGGSGTMGSGTDRSSTPPTTRSVPSGPESLEARVPTVDAVKRLSALGAITPSGATWATEEEGPLKAPRVGGESLCGEPEGVESGFVRTFVLAPPGSEEFLGQYPEATFTLRRFKTPELAATWLADHSGPKYLDCSYLNSRRYWVQVLVGPIGEDGNKAIAPVASGQAVQYHITSVRPDQTQCTTYDDAYYNQAGNYTLTSAFSACGAPVDTAAEQAIVTRALTTLG